MNLFQLTRHLIDIPSVTGSEAEVAQFLASYLRDLNYEVELQVAIGDRANLIAHTGAPPKVVFSTHLDTVPPHIISSEDADAIHGRGACDAKGIIAAQISAAENLRANGYEQIGLLFTVDEEMASAGAVVANDHKWASECCYLINGEPTDNRLAIGTKGSLRFTLTTSGRAAHSAYPEHGESAIEKLLDVLNDLRHCDWPVDDVFGETTCNIGTITGGTKPNIVPATAAAEVQMRLVTEVEPIKEIIATAVGDRAQIEYSSQHAPVRLLALDELPQCVVRFTTDIPYLTRWGKPLLLGPGSILDAHTDHERISKSELSRAVELYVKLAKLLSARVATMSASST